MHTKWGVKTENLWPRQKGLPDPGSATLSITKHVHRLIQEPLEFKILHHLSSNCFINRFGLEFFFTWVQSDDTSQVPLHRKVRILL